MTKRRQKYLSYSETLDFIYSQLPMYQRQGKSAFKKDLSNIIALCQFLGNPHEKLKAIHVAGTNGKGSTSHIIASILQEYDFHVGLYTSPHYMDFRERIKINGKLISKNYVSDFVLRIKPALESIQASFFEITVAMAFDYFASKNVDIAVIETGLGGRLDSTNILAPMLSVITNISMDHVSMLGDTIQLIAGEKAGIIKAETPVVIGDRDSETSLVFESKANNVNAKISYAEDLVGNQEVRRYLKNMDAPAPFQSENIRTAVAAVKVLLKKLKLDYDDERVSRGISKLKENTYYIGRWEILKRRPLIIADSAHNEAGMELVIENLRKQEYDTLHIVLGFVNDKEVGKILQLFPKKARYYFAKANISRGLDSSNLKAKGKENGLSGRSYVSVRNALKAAQRNATLDDLIYIGGSIFVVAEILPYFNISRRS